MALTKLTDNLNCVQSLPDKPSLEADALKAKFDESSNLIKKYINEILTDEIEKLITNTVNSAKVIVENVLTSESAINALSANQGKALKGLIDTINSKLNGIAEGANKTIIENVLTSTSTTNGLSANQGRVLKELIDPIKTKLDGIESGANKTTIVDGLSSTSASAALSANQGKLLDEKIGRRQMLIARGTSTPSGGSNGDVYIQYF